MKEFFSKISMKVIRPIRTQTPFMLRFTTKFICVILSFVFFCLLTQNEQFDLAVYVPAFYIGGNLLLETFFYRVMGFKESRFQDKSLVKAQFKVSLEELDNAALKTNQIKWVTFSVFFLLGTVAFFVFDWNIDILWITTNAYGFVSLFIHGLCQGLMKNMPYFPFNPKRPKQLFNDDSRGMGTTDPSTPIGWDYYYTFILRKP